MGEISSATITAYDFSTCSIGAELASTNTVDTGAFLLDIEYDVETLPVLFEVSNITYKEDFSGQEVNSGEKKTLVTMTPKE